MARLKSTLSMNDSFGTVTEPHVVAKTKGHARSHTPKVAAIVLPIQDATRPLSPGHDLTPRTERDIPFGWSLLGMGALCAAFWSVVLIAFI
jgi:hypothetical protein